MKLKTYQILPVLLITAFSATSHAQVPQESAKGDEQAALRAAENRVRSAVQMAASMDSDSDDGPDPIAQAREEGLIIDVTLEQVKAALAAARATPETEDDIAAARLLHFGSYRFYADDAPATHAKRPSKPKS